MSAADLQAHAAGIDYSRLPEHMQAGARLWIEQGIYPGGFMLAVMENDLVEAVGRADETNRERLPDFVSFFYNEAPRACWRTRENIEAWAERGGLLGGQQ